MGTKHGPPRCKDLCCARRRWPRPRPPPDLATNTDFKIENGGSDHLMDRDRNMQSFGRKTGILNEQRQGGTRSLVDEVIG